MNESALKYVDERLHQWAEWYSRGNLYGLGYPSCSAEYRLMTEGTVVRGTGSKPLPSNKTAEEIEDLVKEMSQHDHLTALVLRCHYFKRGSLRIKANYLKKSGVEISHNHFKYHVDLGHRWLAGRLSGISKYRRYF